MHDAIPEPPTGAAARTLASGQADLLVREEPLLLVVHGQPLLTMRTPGHDDDLALGFLLGEGLVPNAADVASMTAIAGDADACDPNPRRRNQPSPNQPGTNEPSTDELHITLRRPPGELQRQRLARTHEVRSSCGVCGLASVPTMLDDLPPLLPGVPKFAPARIAELLTQLAARQELFALTGGCHGALIATAEPGGPVLGCGEDVGRHNALDKAIGQAARAGADFPRCIAVLSGRAGYDLVVKCLRLRLPVIASVSAPSALAFDLCHAAGATLLGFARGERHTVYCGAERLLGS